MPNGYPPSYPPPYYYMPSRKNWAGIIAGLAALGVGSYFVYWAWKNGWFDNLFGCTEGSTKCIGNDLYKCIDGAWTIYQQNAPGCGPGYVPCSSLGGGCILDGYKKCDISIPTDLCECDAETGDFVLVKHNSTDCIQGNECLDCFYNPGEEVNVCARTVGQIDKCYVSNYDYGCSCVDNQCSSTARCLYNKCWKKANGGTMNILESYLSDCEQIYGGNICYYDLHDGLDGAFPFPFAASNLSNGKIYYKWGPILPTLGAASLCAYNQNVGWRVIWENPALWIVGTEGYFILDNYNFQEMGIEKLSFGIACLGTNIKPTGFLGTWSA